jgi:uncharacterized surface protein with fasciclin (FAS1) repeats
MRNGPWLTLLAGAALLAGCGSAEEANQAAASGNGAADSSTGGGTGNSAQASRTLGDAVGQNAQLSQFAEALQAAGMAEVLRAGSYTVFAPTNAAFDRVPAEARARLAAAEGRDELRQLLSGHIVVGMVTAQDLSRAIERGQGRATLATVAGSNLTVTKEGDALVITDAAGGRARVAQADQLSSNGSMHLIDALLMPGGG